MANPTPKPTSTRVQLPVGLSGAEPSVVPVGSLAFASDTDQVRVQTSDGWVDVGGGDPSTPLTRPPLVSTFDDNFESLDSLANYTIWNSTDNVNMSRIGDVDFAANTVTASQYRASMVGGVFYLQLPQSKTIYVYRAVTAGDHLYCANIAPQAVGTQPAGADGAGCWAFVSANTGGRPDTNNVAVVGVYNASADWQALIRIGAVNVSNVTRAYDVPNTLATADLFIGTARTSWVYSVEDGRAIRFAPAVAFTPTRAWFGWYMVTPAFNSGSIFGLYFLREQPSDSWYVSHAPSSGGGGGGGGGGGDIVEIVAGTGITVTNGTGPVVTVAATGGGGTLAGDANGPAGANEVNAIHETSGPTQLTFGNINDFQLLQRVGATVVGTAYPPTTLVGDVNGPMVSNQVNAIHETSGPTQLTIGSIGEGQAVARVGGALVGVNAGDSNPWTAQPSAATYADEFISDTSSSYSFYNRTNSVAMVRVGNVDPYGGGSLGNGQYNSTCYGSWLVVQFPPGKDCLMYKALTTVNSLVTARFQTRAYQSAAAVNNPYAGLFCAASSGGLPDIASNSSEVGVATRSGTTSNINTFQVVGGTTTDDSAAAGAYSNSHMDCFAQRFVGTTRTSWAYSTVNGATNNQPPARTFSPTVGFVGFRFLTGATPNSVDQTFQVDFLRIQPNTAWIYSGPAGVVTIPSGSALSADITTYPAKTTPVAADQIYIADSAASNVIKRSTLSSVVNFDNPWTRPRTSATFADEFTTDTSASYSFYNRTNAVAMTRVGNVDPYGGGALGNGQYNSSCVGSWLFVQFPANKDCLMYKTQSVVDSLVTARVSTRTLVGTPPGDDNPFLVLFCAATSGGLPDLLNSTFTGYQTRASGNVQYARYQNVGGVTTDDATVASATNGLMDCVSERFNVTSRDSWHYSSVNGATNRVPARTFTPTVTLVGFRYVTGATIAATDQVLAIDFLRVVPKAQWVYDI